MFKIKWLIVLATAFAAIAAQPASASVVLYLTDDSQCGGGCGTPPYAKITLTQVLGDPYSVDVDVSEINQKLVTTGGPHETFAFNITDGTSTPPTITISNLTAGFSIDQVNTAGTIDYSVAGTQDKNVNNLGYFAYLIAWGTSGGGNGSPGPLDFRVTEENGHTLSPTDFIAALNDETCTGSGADKICKPTGTSTGYIIAADILGPSGNTGEVAAVEAIPEPFTLSLFGAGLLGLGALRRRKAV